MMSAATSLEHIVITDKNDIITDANESFCEYTGYMLDELVGKHLTELGLYETAAGLTDVIRTALEDKGYWQGEAWLSRKDHKTAPALLTITLNTDSESHFEYLQYEFLDITSEERTEHRLTAQSGHDPATGLANRNTFIKELNKAIQMQPQNLMAVILLEVDQIAVLLETIGEHAETELMNDISHRLRFWAKPGTFLGRYNETCFAIFITNPPPIQALIAALAQHFTTPTVVNNRQIRLTPNLGVTYYPDDAAQANKLLKNASLALSQARQNDQSQYTIYNRSSEKNILGKLELENDLHQALKNNEFILYYQPLIDLKSGKVNGAEALIRWQHPKHGLLPPNKFIPTMEASDLIIHVSEWIIKEVCQQHQKWRQRGLALDHLTLNLSPKHFIEPSLFKTIQANLEETGIQPHTLYLEITENLLIKNIENCRTTLRKLKAIGINIALDDFGTGYSSLSYLSHFRFDTLKIDRSFIQGMLYSEADARLVEAIIAMGQVLEMSIVAEGVETEEQLSFLKLKDCDMAQGFLFSKPCPPDDFFAYAIESNESSMN